MAMHPSQGVVSLKRKHAGRHFVEDNAKRIQVAAMVDNPVHAAGLFRRHVGKHCVEQVPTIQV